jgi:hypothetical protein
MGEFRFLIRFPPHRKIVDTLISDITYFRMKKEEVLVSLKAWIRDIEPYDVLEEAWVQISGIPPKWSNWNTFRQITSSLGKMVKVDWSALFSSFFGLIRVKVACKDASKIPKRLYEIQKNLYLIQFKVEGVAKDVGSNVDPDDGDNDNNDYRLDEDIGEDEFDQEFDQPEKKTVINFPLIKTVCLGKDISDHTPILVSSGEGGGAGKKRFRFEKWWSEKRDFKEVVSKAWNYEGTGGNPVSVW